ncbi:ABC transporter ATP-binding protein [Aquibaculum arenosum]|uniref:ABC transporter ATP-binding protein n=1 Tax=Aquibaculum arenosum TaxID=3032591 RepID=A0ABT5YRQ3_9PROT|nr:ABC transporter ATP-binding protein [Fodinicurvata sp. CAU 1616]MDF2097451.1 ABC transporter ATP-binding protein [Fodinicurvata sp. CAU 1616]
MLEIEGLDVFYGDFQVLWDVSLTVGSAEVVAVLGPNGSGKSTVLKAIMGLTAAKRGRITFEGHDLRRVPTHGKVDLGISMVLERRRLFGAMSVQENVLLGAYSCRDKAEIARRLEWVESLFPIIAERRGQEAGRMSGGEQQMVAIARSLMSKPRLLLMDEPFLGLAPRIVHQILDIIRKIHAEGISVVFNEQNVQLSFGLSDRGYLLESGRVVLSGTGDEMLSSDVVRRVYLGG